MQGEEGGRGGAKCEGLVYYNYASVDCLSVHEGFYMQGCGGSVLVRGRGCICTHMEGDRVGGGGVSTSEGYTHT